MNTPPASVIGILDRLSIGVSRTSIRHYATPRLKKKRHHLTGFEPGHGERIFVYNHIENGMIIYSHEPELPRESAKHLAQIPFTVKKQKPAVLRHDYWQPMCMIQFDAGRGVVGRNVFRQLREFRQLHELHWGWQAEEFKKLDKRTRGERIHDQKPNAVADMAAVLAGVGRGNLMWTEEPEPVPVEDGATAAKGGEAVRGDKGAESKYRPAQAPEATTHNTTETKADNSDTSEVALTTTPSAPAKAKETAVAKSPKVTKKKAKGPAPESAPKRLLKATIYWANDVDLDWARKWSENVIHEIGLPDGVKVWNWKTKMLREETVAAAAPDAPEGEAAEESKEQTASEQKLAVESKEQMVSEQKAAEQKKGLLGWVGAKMGGSSQDARA